MTSPTGSFDAEVTATREVVEHDERVTFVRHLPDGLFECEGDTDRTEDNAVAASMAQLVAADPSLRQVAALPVGWAAMRFDGDWSLLPPEGYVPASVPAAGLLVRFGQRSSARHRAGGVHDIDGADCPNCDKPMLRMLSLDTSDQRLRLAKLGVPFVHLLFCWTCNLAQAQTSYRLLPSGGVRLLAPARGGVEEDFPYENYPQAFGGVRVGLEAVPESEALLVAGLNDGSLSWSDLPAHERHLTVPRHQVGGRPLWLQGPRPLLCPTCSMPMSFLACCADDAPDGRGYTGNEFVQVVFMLCEQDRVVASYQECD